MKRLILAIVVLACICSLAPAPANAGPTATATASAAPNVAKAPAYDAYATSSPYAFNTHNCPPENCGTVDECGTLPSGTPCGRLYPNCTCKKCHNWGTCTH